RFGKVSNVLAGVTGRYYTNYYKFICDSSVYATHRQLKSCAFSVFLGHEFICGKFSLLTQGAINFFNPFYRYHNPVILDFYDFSETWTSARLGFQYYFFTPDASRRFNMYSGIYINANFGRADFSDVCLGFVF
ncbi:MAG TPA: hypothetical protein VII99_09560, partial [Bacteroidia bacterium]